MHLKRQLYDRPAPFTLRENQLLLSFSTDGKDLFYCPCLRTAAPPNADPDSRLLGSETLRGLCED